MRVLSRLLKHQLGVTAVEYALIGALIAVAAIVALALIGTRLSTTFSTVGGKL
jgi:pilus assembly protein Flp/PilA